MKGASRRVPELEAEIRDGPSGTGVVRLHLPVRMSPTASRSHTSRRHSGRHTAPHERNGLGVHVYVRPLFCPRVSPTFSWQPLLLRLLFVLVVVSSSSRGSSKVVVVVVVVVVEYTNSSSRGGSTRVVVVVVAVASIVVVVLLVVLVVVVVDW
jgi:hypothetical protein